MQNHPSLSANFGGVLAMPAQPLVLLPEMPDSMTFGVFAFDFRGHGDSAEGSSGGIDSAGFLMDARAALALVKTFGSVEGSQIITVGASIGADAAADACVTLDGFLVAENQVDQSCRGVMSLSPGDFLGVGYVDAVEALMNSPHDPVVRCLAAEDDGQSPDRCNNASGDDYAGTIYPGSDHGIALLSDGRTPDIGQLILDFLSCQRR